MQDPFCDGYQWRLQQLNNVTSKGASVPGEYIASPAATAADFASVVHPGLLT